MNRLRKFSIRRLMLYERTFVFSSWVGIANVFRKYLISGNRFNKMIWSFLEKFENVGWLKKALSLAAIHCLINQLKLVINGDMSVEFAGSKSMLMENTW